MKLSVTAGGFALYKESDVIGQCSVTPAPKGADITSLSVLPQWRRKGYGSYLLKEILRRFGGYDREAATVFTAPLPAGEGERLFWKKFGFVPEGGRLCRRRTPDLTAVRLVQDYLAAHLPHAALCIDATCGNGGDTAFLCRLVGRRGGCWASTSSPRPSLPPAPGSKRRASPRSFSATATQTSCTMSGPVRRTS